MKGVVSKFSVWVLSGLFCVSTAFAATELDDRIWEANEVLKEFVSIPEHRIPPNLLKKARAIAIFPNMVKAGFIVAGQFGRGVVLYRDESSGKWSPPAFFRISGASVGFQIGGQSTDVILVVTNERGVRALLRNKFTIGVDASVAAGPSGRDAEVRTDWHLKANILSYSRSKGLFAGVSLDGVVVNQDKKANAGYYGSELTAEDILMGRKVKATTQAKELIQTLERYS